MNQTHNPKVPGSNPGPATKSYSLGKIYFKGDRGYDGASEGVIGSRYSG